MKYKKKKTLLNCWGDIKSVDYVENDNKDEPFIFFFLWNVVKVHITTIAIISFVSELRFIRRRC